MACYAALVSLAQVLDQILDHDQHAIVLHEQQQMKSLHENVILLLTFLEGFLGEAGNLEARITIAANEAEDIIQYHILDEISPKYGCFKVLNCLCQVILSIRNSVFAGSNRQRLYEELRKSIEEIESISKEAMRIKNKNSMSIDHPSGSGPSSPRHAHNENDTVIGFEQELLEIKGRLCGEQSKLEIIPISGMGGIGKTTLARYAYDDPLTVHHFDIRAWVTVSQNYELRRFLLRLLCSIDASNKELNQGMGEGLLMELVYKYLKGRRYLIVIDDMWTTNVWDDVRRMFPDDYNGTRIIITTRELDVASYVESSNHCYEMQLMDAYRSWSLLKEKVFGLQNCPPHLEEIGRQIAENCRGLPLAIVVIAGVLSKADRTQDTWINIGKNVKKAVNSRDEILSLSYKHLPHHLRPCFLYMGCFQEDDEIKVSKLVKLWAAEGFLKPSGSKNVEEVAEEYLEGLAKRSLVSVLKKSCNGKIKVVKIHDLLRDLSQRKGREERFVHVVNEICVGNQICVGLPEGFENLRRLSICSDFVAAGCPNFHGLPLRTILISTFCYFNFWRSCKLLRVLDAPLPVLEPVEIGELFHLRYLAFNFTGKIPESLSNLQNLQTLIILSMNDLYMPSEIWDMPELRHLILYGPECFLPDPFIENRRKSRVLENLQTLSGVSDFTWSERVSEMIPNINKLGLYYNDFYGTGWSNYGLKNLIHLHKLEKLNAYVGPHDYSQSNLSRDIAFPVSLKQLSLSGCNVPWNDMTIVGSLPNLEVLKLERNACRGLEWETTEGEFCRLKVLLINRTDPRNWITESSHFPILERLLLRGCHTLREIPYSIGEIPTLQLIEVDSCSSFVVESAKRIQEEVESFGNDLQLRLLKNISQKWDLISLLKNRYKP